MLFSFFGGTSGGRTHDKRIKSTTCIFLFYQKPNNHAPFKTPLTKSIKVSIKLMHHFLTNFELPNQPLHAVQTRCQEPSHSHQRDDANNPWISIKSRYLQDCRLSFLLGQVLLQRQIQSQNHQVRDTQRCQRVCRSVL